MPFLLGHHFDLTATGNTRIEKTPVPRKVAAGALRLLDLNCRHALSFHSCSLLFTCVDFFFDIKQNEKHANVQSPLYFRSFEVVFKLFLPNAWIHDEGHLPYLNKNTCTILFLFPEVLWRSCFVFGVCFDMSSTLVHLIGNVNKCDDS